MKILRFLNDGKAEVGVLINNEILSISNFLSQKFEGNFNHFLNSWDIIQEELNDFIKTNSKTINFKNTQLLPPVSNPEKFLAIGMNYKRHRAEAIDAGIKPPRNQMWFTKQNSCINSPFGNVIKPDSTMMLDYEVELAFIVKKKCKNIKASDAKEFIFGFLICNDFSMRDWQLHNMPERIELMIAKSHDSHGPIGPWIVTCDEISDPHNLNIKCYVNGELKQSSNTSDMIWNCYEQLEYLSSAMTLNPGDIVTTGTPPGSGFSPRGSEGKSDKSRKGNFFLEENDVVKCEIDSIGYIENKIVVNP